MKNYYPLWVSIIFTAIISMSCFPLEPNYSDGSIPQPNALMYITDHDPYDLKYYGKAAFFFSVPIDPSKFSYENIVILLNYEPVNVSNSISEIVFSQDKRRITFTFRNNFLVQLHDEDLVNVEINGYYRCLDDNCTDSVLVARGSGFNLVVRSEDGMGPYVEKASPPPNPDPEVEDPAFFFPPHGTLMADFSEPLAAISLHLEGPKLPVYDPRNKNGLPWQPGDITIRLYSTEGLELYSKYTIGLFSDPSSVFPPNDLLTLLNNPDEIPADLQQLQVRATQDASGAALLYNYPLGGPVWDDDIRWWVQDYMLPGTTTDTMDVAFRTAAIKIGFPAHDPLGENPLTLADLKNADGLIFVTGQVACDPDENTKGVKYVEVFLNDFSVGVARAACQNGQTGGSFSAYIDPYYFSNFKTVNRLRAVASTNFPEMKEDTATGDVWFDKPNGAGGYDEIVFHLDLSETSIILGFARPYMYYFPLTRPGDNWEALLYFLENADVLLLDENLDINNPISITRTNNIGFFDFAPGSNSGPYYLLVSAYGDDVKPRQDCTGLPAGSCNYAWTISGPIYPTPGIHTFEVMVPQRNLRNYLNETICKWRNTGEDCSQVQPPADKGAIWGTLGGADRQNIRIKVFDGSDNEVTDAVICYAKYNEDLVLNPEDCALTGSNEVNGTYSNGMFLIEDLPEGAYTIVSEQTYDDSSSQYKVNDVFTAALQPVITQVFLPPRPWIEGTVVDFDGNAVGETMKVSLPEYALEAAWDTFANKFSFLPVKELPQCKNVSFRVEDAGSGNFFRTNSFPQFMLRRISKDIQLPVVNKDLGSILFPDNTVGAVIGEVDDYSGAPLGGAVVGANREDNGMPEEVVYLDENGLPDPSLTSTSYGGRFIINNIMPGDIRLHTSAYSVNGWHEIPSVVINVEVNAVTAGNILQLPPLTDTSSIGFPKMAIHFAHVEGIFLDEQKVELLKDYDMVNINFAAGCVSPGFIEQLKTANPDIILNANEFTHVLSPVEFGYDGTFWAPSYHEFQKLYGASSLGSYESDGVRKFSGWVHYDSGLPMDERSYIAAFSDIRFMSDALSEFYSSMMFPQRYWNGTYNGRFWDGIWHDMIRNDKSQWDPNLDCCNSHIVDLDRDCENDVTIFNGSSGQIYMNDFYDDNAKISSGFWCPSEDAVNGQCPGCGDNCLVGGTRSITCMDPDKICLPTQWRKAWINLLANHDRILGDNMFISYNFTTSDDYNDDYLPYVSGGNDEVFGFNNNRIFQWAFNMYRYIHMSNYLPPEKDVLFLEYSVRRPELTGGDPFESDRMRIALGSALMGNGFVHPQGDFFSLLTPDIQANYAWFDEFSVNLATGQAVSDPQTRGDFKGYLGAPLEGFSESGLPWPGKCYRLVDEATQQFEELPSCCMRLDTDGDNQSDWDTYNCVWYRLFENGAVFVNPAAGYEISSGYIDSFPIYLNLTEMNLDHKYKRIFGCQDPCTNDGSKVIDMLSIPKAECISGSYDRPFKDAVILINDDPLFPTIPLNCFE